MATGVSSSGVSSSFVNNIDDLSDVDTSGAADGEVLTFNSTSGDWEASAAGGGGLVFLSSVTASDSATIDLETTFDSTFDSYVIEATSVSSASNAVVLQCRLKIGGSYLAAGYSYHTGALTSISGLYASLSNNVGTVIEVADNLSSAGSRVVDFTMRLKDPTNTDSKKKVYWQYVNSDTSLHKTGAGGGGNDNSLAALTGVRFLMSSGNISSGTFRLYGITNS